MSLIQSTGHTSTQAKHKVHVQFSMAYSFLNFKTAFSGQIKRQLSHAVQVELISNRGIMNLIIKNCKIFKTAK